MQWIVPAAVLVLSAISGVQCMFGLPVTSPIYSTTIISSVGNGINLLVRANASFKATVDTDTSGTVKDLVTVANYVHSPLNQLLGSIVSAATTRNAEGQKIFANISQLITTTSSAINDASNAVTSLQPNTRASLYNQLKDNIASLSTSLVDLSNGMGVLQTQVAEAANSATPVTILNIASFINQTVIANFTNPLRKIQTELVQISEAVNTIGSERATAIAYQVQMNTTINNAVRNIVNAEVAFNKSVSDVFQRTGQLQTTTFKAITQTYAPITNNPSTYNGGDISNLTQFLTDMTAAETSLTQFIELGTNYSMEQVYAVSRDQIGLISSTFADITTNIADQFLRSSSQFATRCTERYQQQLQRSQLERLTQCITQESNSFRQTLQFAQNQLDLAKNAAGALYTQITRNCKETRGACTSTSFAAFPDHSQRLQNKFSVVAGGVSNDEYIVTGRIKDCVSTTSADLIDNARNIQTKFGSCLTTGS